tara:strand:- start:398 stop:1252 length:855 start_codon:yes stop_codon:yes gene_type:complete
MAQETQLFKVLEDLHRKPDVFSVYTADTLWTEPHLASQMLQTHLNQDTPLASRPMQAIDRTVNWLDQKFGLEGKAVCDLGCGPGLYTERYARAGATVQGLDFSGSSIEYARQSAADQGLEIAYRVANYLTDPLPPGQDLTTLIYCDFCPLSPLQRSTLLGEVHDSLKFGGSFVFDVMSTKTLEKYVEQVLVARNHMDGFWSANDYFTIHQAHRYEDENVTLDRFTIIEEDRIWDVYNWMQYFTPESIEAELNANGFDKVEIVSGLDPEEKDDTSFGVIAQKQRD